MTVVILLARNVIALALLVPCFAAAQETRLNGDALLLTLSAARQKASLSNLGLAATRLDTTVARGNLRQAETLRFNPALDALAANGGNGAEFGLAQELEVFGQRGLRINAAQAAFYGSAAGIRDAHRLTIAAVDRAFYRLASADRRSDLSVDVLRLNETIAAIAKRQLEAGEISRLDYNLAVIEEGRARARALASKRERQELQARLGELLNLSVGIELMPVLEPTDHPPDTTGSGLLPNDAEMLVQFAKSLSTDSLLRVAVDRRPDLSAATARVQRLQAEAMLASREGLPNLIARVAAEPGSKGTTTLRPGIGFTIPAFNRHRGERQARSAAAQQAELEQAVIVRRIHSEVVAALDGYRAASSEVAVLEATVLPPARQNRLLLETAYREGKVGLPVLLLIRNQVFDAERDYWTAWLAEREALVTLEEVTGLRVPATKP